MPWRLWVNWYDGCHSFLLPKDRLHREMCAVSKPEQSKTFYYSALLSVLSFAPVFLLVLCTSMTKNNFYNSYYETWNYGHGNGAIQYTNGKQSELRILRLVTVQYTTPYQQVSGRYSLYTRAVSGRFSTARYDLLPETIVSSRGSTSWYNTYTWLTQPVDILLCIEYWDWFIP